MGLAASQARFLNLTSRNTSISRQLQHLSLEKMALTRESQKYSKEYNEALSAKTLKWTNNNGVTYTDLSYNTLMRPNAFNNKTPYLLTDSNGRVVLDSKYTEYAKLISPNGAAGGDYDSNRTALLSQITGIPEESFNSYNVTDKATEEALTAKTEAKAAMDKAYKKATISLTAEDIAKNYWGKIGNIDFKSTSNVDLGKKDSAKSTLESLKTSIINAMQNKFIGDKEPEAFKTAVETVIADLTEKMNGDKEFSDDCIPENDGKYSLNIQAFAERIMSVYASLDGVNGISKDGDKTKYQFKGDDASWQVYLDAKAAYEEASKTYSDSAQENEMIFTAEQENKILYFDSLFQAIADNGWVQDDMVEDGNYLNQMMQNNFYTITTMTRNDLYDENSTESAKQYKYDYDMDIPSNFDKIISVNDDNIRQDAQAKYEYNKSIINAKESRIDTRMKNLQTEQAAINQMMESIKGIMKDNIDRTMNIFTA